MKLTQKFCTDKNLKDGYYADSGVSNLGFKVFKDGKYRNWIFRRIVRGKKFEFSLGSIKKLDVNHAKAQATELVSLSDKEFIAFMDKWQSNRTPKKDTDTSKPVTFQDVVKEYEKWNLTVGNWKEYSKQHKVFIGKMNNHVFPYIGDKIFSEISEEDISKMLIPIWDKLETVNRVLRTVKNIFDWGKAKQLRTKDNPADRNGALKYLLPQGRYKPTNRGALSVQQLPYFMASLYKQIDSGDASCWRCAFFAILTATRSLTARSAKWEQIDWDNKEWIIPASQLKVSDNGALIVPLSDQVIWFLNKIRPKGNTPVRVNTRGVIYAIDNTDYSADKPLTGLIFPNWNGEIMSDSMISNIVARLERIDGQNWNDEIQGLKLDKQIRATIHGIARATFRTWAQDDTLGNDKKYSARIAELCLHHKVKDNYGGAYERNLSMLRRRELMNDWAKYCFSLIKIE